MHHHLTHHPHFPPGCHIPPDWSLFYNVFLRPLLGGDLSLGRHVAMLILLASFLGKSHLIYHMAQYSSFGLLTATSLVGCHMSHCDYVTMSVSTSTWSQHHRDIETLEYVAPLSMSPSSHPPCHHCHITTATSLPLPCGGLSPCHYAISTLPCHW